MVRVLVHLMYLYLPNRKNWSGEGGSRTHKSWRIAAFKADGLLTGAQPLRVKERDAAAGVGPANHPGIESGAGWQWGTLAKGNLPVALRLAIRGVGFIILFCWELSQVVGAKFYPQQF